VAEVRAVLILLGLAALALAQTPPTISPSFSATTAATFGNRTFNGQEFVDAQNQRNAFDHKFADGNTESEDFFTQNHTAYRFGTYNGTQYCRVERDPRPFFNQWEWVATSKSTGACTVGQQSGQGWSASDHGATITLCANSNIPLQTTFTDGEGHSETTVYSSFVPGVPTPDHFAVPAHCQPHN